MATILQINNSIFGDAGKSSTFADNFIIELRKLQPNLKVIRRNLASEPLPHLTADAFRAALIARDQRTTEQAKAASVADAVVAELLEADQLVIASPTYNFNISSTLKAWFDHAARAGTTFRYTPNGPEGLLKHIKAYVFISSGGYHLGTERDFQGQYVRFMLKFLGITDVELSYLEGMTKGDEAISKGMQAAQERLRSLAASWIEPQGIELPLGQTAKA